MMHCQFVHTILEFKFFLALQVQCFIVQCKAIDEFAQNRHVSVRFFLDRQSREKKIVTTEDLYFPGGSLSLFHLGTLRPLGVKNICIQQKLLLLIPLLYFLQALFFFVFLVKLPLFHLLLLPLRSRLRNNYPVLWSRYLFLQALGYGSL